jgi:hypothetical protein
MFGAPALCRGGARPVRLLRLASISTAHRHTRRQREPAISQILQEEHGFSRAVLLPEKSGFSR